MTLNVHPHSIRYVKDQPRHQAFLWLLLIAITFTTIPSITTAKVLNDSATTLVTAPITTPPITTPSITTPSINSAIVYYGANPPIQIIKQFDYVIIEGASVTSQQLKHLDTAKNTVAAYVSIGEFEPWRNPKEVLPEYLKITKNKIWKGDIVDVSKGEWHQFILNNRIKPLIEKGFQGVFLDTLDSYQIADLTDEQQKNMQEGLIQLIRKIKQTFPNIAIILNRGFEIIPHIHSEVDAVLVESLFQTFEKIGDKYHFKKTSEQHQQNLTTLLNSIKDQFNLPIIVLDYLPQKARDKAIKTATKIRDAGFIPFISVPTLDRLGISQITYEPRKILALYDSSLYEKNPLDLEKIFNFVGPVLDYYGYTIEYLDVHKNKLPTNAVNQYAGIVSWFEKPLEQSKVYYTWLKKNLDEGLPIAIFHHSGFQFGSSTEVLFGLSVDNQFRKKHLSQPQLSTWLNFESEFNLENYKQQPIHVIKNKNCKTCQYHASYTTNHPQNASNTVHGVVTAEWGGWVQAPWIFSVQPDQSNEWIIDPFEFLDQSLNLSRRPAPDVTTHYGRRLLITHIDGDGFLNKAELPSTPYSSEVILEKIFKRYKIPHTVSVIEGEIGLKGLYPQHNQELEEIARQIFALDHIEPASHTYSHPFDWTSLDHLNKRNRMHGLKIPNYKYTPRRDLLGSLKYVETLLPAEKVEKEQGVDILLWSGQALPREVDLATLHKAGKLNMNGGNTSAREGLKSLIHVSPMYRPVGPYRQVFAPIMNENVYTNDWTGPFYGFRQVIQTFEFTDQPRRLKPLNIYYHFYSGEKLASLNALIDVYEWALQQDNYPVYVSDYLHKVNNFFEIDLFSTLDNNWIIHNAKDIQSFRIPLSKKLSLSKSQGVMGYRDLHDGRYIHTISAEDNQAESKPIILNLSNKSSSSTTVSSMPYIEQSNGVIHQYSFDSETGYLSFDIQGSQALFIDIKHPNITCQFPNVPWLKVAIINEQTTRLELVDKQSAQIDIPCHSIRDEHSSQMNTTSGSNVSGSNVSGSNASGSNAS